MTGERRSAASFRDPSGFVFERGGEIYRQVQPVYGEHLDLLFASGLHDELVAAGLLVPSERVGLEHASVEGAHAVLRHERIPTISYPYEWSFSQLKDAALLTLETTRRSMEKGMVLKDASAYNIQFFGGKPVLIDTLSFEAYVEGEPWIAYRQFCSHFLAPLALMSHVDVRLGQLLRPNLDGIPLDLASRLLPGGTKFKAGLLAHIHLHGKATNQAATEEVKKVTISKTALLALLDSLRGTVEGLKWSPGGTQWGDYYSDTNYTDTSMDEKRRLVRAFIERAAPRTMWDLGANTGEFSRIGAQLDIPTVAWDIDPAAVEKHYLAVKGAGETRMLPLLQDLTNPSPGLGWAGRERDSLMDRGPVDLVMGLALIHHLAIGNNVPLPQVAAFFAQCGRHAIIEFVPKADSQVRRLLGSRKDIFPTYDEVGFEASLAGHFTIVAREKIAGTERTLYLLARSEP